MLEGVLVDWRVTTTTRSAVLPHTWRVAGATCAPWQLCNLANIGICVSGVSKDGVVPVAHHPRRRQWRDEDRAIRHPQRNCLEDLQGEVKKRQRPARRLPTNGPVPGSIRAGVLRGGGGGGRTGGRDHEVTSVAGKPPPSPWPPAPQLQRFSGTGSSDTRAPRFRAETRFSTCRAARRRGRGAGRGGHRHGGGHVHHHRHCRPARRGAAAGWMRHSGVGGGGGSGSCPSLLPSAVALSRLPPIL